MVQTLVLTVVLDVLVPLVGLSLILNGSTEQTLSNVMEVAVHLDVYELNLASQSMTILIFVQT